MAIAYSNTEPPMFDRYKLNTNMPLHQLAQKRMRVGRDLKIIITAKDSETGVGKTTCAGWLAMNWTRLFANQEWEAEKHSTLDPHEYFKIIANVQPGTVVIVDDAEELDARRSMQHLNVDFSQRWMLMRLKQVITILTLPSPSSIDSRLEELADIWINIEIRGRGVVHDIRVNSYGSRNVLTEKKHKITFPNVSEHPEMLKLQKKKEDKMDKWDNPGEEDEEFEMPIEAQTELALAKKEALGLPWRKVPESSPHLTFSGEYLRQQAKELEE